MAPSILAPPSYRIVIGDDDVDTVERTALWLQMNGHETREAFDGLEVLRQTEAFDPQLILLDLGMPKLDGYEVTRAIRDSVRRQQPVIVGVSRHGDLATKQLCAQTGFDLHLVKPLDLTLFDHCALLLEESYRLHETIHQSILQQKTSVTDFIWLEVQMAHTFLDVARTTRSEATKRRCLQKALRVHEVAVRLIWRQGYVHPELEKALDELLARHGRLCE